MANKLPNVFGRAPAHCTSSVFVWKSRRHLIEVFESSLDGGWVWIVTLSNRGTPLLDHKSSLPYTSANAACRAVEQYLGRVYSAIAAIGVA